MFSSPAEGLFANLRSDSQSTPANAGTSNISQPRSLSTSQSLFSPSAKSNALLDLLKFGSEGNKGSSQSAQNRAVSSSPRISDKNVASVLNTATTADPDTLNKALAASASPGPISPSVASHQDSLLKLLSKSTPKPEVSNSRSIFDVKDPITPEGASRQNEQDRSEQTSSPIHYFGSAETTPIPFQPEKTLNSAAAQSGSIFTYVNPFEKLAASSPRLSPGSKAPASEKASPSTTAKTVDVNETKSVASRRKQAIGRSVPGQIASSRSNSGSFKRAAPEPLERDFSTETVAEALDQVGSQVHQEVQNKFADLKIDEPKSNPASMKVNEEGDNSAGSGDGGPKGKKEDDNVSLKNPEISLAPQVIHDSASQPVVRGPTSDVTEDRAVCKDSNKTQSQAMHAQTAESCEDKAPIIHETIIFPAVPFSKMDIRKGHKAVPLRQDSILQISRLLKSFDVADAQLATATRECIVYAMPKTGGLRVIGQAHGHTALLFSDAQDRLLDVAVSTTEPHGLADNNLQRVIATGISGSVYWTTLCDGDRLLDEDQMQAGTIIFTPSASDQASDCQVSKTRAKKSGRHPEFFAIGSGRSVNIVLPSCARNSVHFGEDCKVNRDKFFAERSLKVTMNNSGVDFAFSGDDSALATLDQAGIMQVWDIRDLIAEDNASAARLAPIALEKPVLTFRTCPSGPSESGSSPTSVFFADRHRTYRKTMAQRYLIVGSNQNYTIQLWDICLGQLVQELNLPHDNKDDPVCSIGFEPLTGMLIVGHPARNTMFLINLSTPKYHLPHMSQAELIKRKAMHDSTLARTEATAIMSGYREISLSSLGQLRSLDVLSVERALCKEGEDDSKVLFECYIMHSKGVVCLGITAKDLGWNAEHKPSNPIDAGQDMITICRLNNKTVQLNSELPSQESPAEIPRKETAKPLGSMINVNAKETKTKNNLVNGQKENEATQPSSKEDPAASSKSLKAKASTPVPTGPKKMVERNTNTNKANAVPESQAKREAATGPQKSADVLPVKDDDKRVPKPPEQDINQIVRDNFHGLGSELAHECGRIFESKLQNLHGRLNTDREAQNVAAAGAQEAILRLVSKQLGENVEKTLTMIVNKAVAESAAPLIAATAEKYLQQNFSTVMHEQLFCLVSPSLKAAMKDNLGTALHSSNFQGNLAKALMAPLKEELMSELPSLLQKQLTPALQNAFQEQERLSQKTGMKDQAQYMQLLDQRKADAAKLGELSNQIRAMTQLVQQMSHTQADLQTEIQKLQQQRAAPAQLQPATTSNRQTVPPMREASVVKLSPEQVEFEAIKTRLEQQQWEEATVMWLRSPQQETLFDQLFIHFDPRYFAGVSQLTVLSVGAAVTSTLERHPDHRLYWLEMVLSSVKPNAPEIQPLARKVLDVIAQRLQDNYMRIAEENPQDPILRRMAAAAKQSRLLMGAFPLHEGQ